MNCRYKEKKGKQMIEKKNRRQTNKTSKSICRIFYFKVVNLIDDVHKVCIFKSLHDIPAHQTPPPGATLPSYTSTNIIMYVCEKIYTSHKKNSFTLC